MGLGHDKQLCGCCACKAWRKSHGADPLVRLIKTRCAKNAADHWEAQEAIGKVREFIERASGRSE